MPFSLFSVLASSLQTYTFFLGCCFIVAFLIKFWMFSILCFDAISGNINLHISFFSASGTFQFQLHCLFSESLNLEALRPYWFGWPIPKGVLELLSLLCVFILLWMHFFPCKDKEIQRIYFKWFFSLHQILFCCIIL